MVPDDRVLLSQDGHVWLFYATLSDGSQEGPDLLLCSASHYAEKRIHSGVEEGSINLKRIGAIFAALVVVFALYPGKAQQEIKIPRVELILNGGQSPSFEALREGLVQLGYVEGHNIFIEARFAEGQLDRVPEFAAELVRLNVDVIATLGAVGASSLTKQNA
jgi:hypothetical protein